VEPKTRIALNEANFFKWYNFLVPTRKSAKATLQSTLRGMISLNHMSYQEFVKELISRFGEEKGVLMALRAEVGFLRKYIEKMNLPDFIEQEKEAIKDFLDRHPKKDTIK